MSAIPLRQRGRPAKYEDQIPAVRAMLADPCRPTYDEIAAATGVPIWKISAIYQDLKSEAPVDKEPGHGEGEDAAADPNDSMASKDQQPDREAKPR